MTDVDCAVDPAPAAADLARLAAGTHPDPHAVLGVHRGDGHTVLRVLRPNADAVSALIDGVRHELRPLGAGLFGIAFARVDDFDYRLQVRRGDAEPGPAAHDGYRFDPTVGTEDLRRCTVGTHHRLWRVLGAHPRTLSTAGGPVRGVSFAVWAPNAVGVTLIGDFNGWHPTAAPMRLLGASGVWELFWPGFEVGGLYKFRVHGADGVVTERADPLAFATEVPPRTASRVTESRYRWSDDTWLAERARRDPLTAPMSIYEVHLGSWRPGLDYRSLATELTEYVVTHGFTHVELLPVTEHPFGGSWGYQVTSYYAPTARFGTPDEFRALVDALHRAGVGVILDWVPGHFPKDDWALARFDGTALYEHADPQRAEQLDWGTYVFDFGRPQVRNFLIANARYWISEFHLDGLRVDAVASMLYLDYSRPAGGWTPNVYGGRENLEAMEFLRELNRAVHQEAPGVVTIAEESTSWPGVTRLAELGGLGFSMKWDMAWMHDTLGYLRHDPVYRSYHHHEMTFSMRTAHTENFMLALSHDEVVHGKGTLRSRMPGDRRLQAAGLRALLAYQWAHPGKQLLFMGQEFGQWAEWCHDRGLDWPAVDDEIAAGTLRLVGDLNRAYRSRPALWSRDFDPTGYGWIDANDAVNNVFGFLRYGSDGSVLGCVINFAGTAHTGYRLGLPSTGRWREVLNTDARGYGGDGLGNCGGVDAEDRPWHGRPASAELTLPASAALWLEPA